MGSWKIIVNGSTVDFEDDYKFIVTQFTGAGMAPIDVISTQFGLLDGSIFQRQRAGDRSLTMIGLINGSNVTALHQNRKNLINAVKPDRSASAEAVVLQYTGAASTVQASAYYDTGLELNTVTTTKEQIALKFLMFDPYWEKTTSSSATLTTQASFSASRVAQRAACGSWGTLGNGLNSEAYSIVSGSDGTLYFGGAFTTASGATASRVAQYNAAGWIRVGNGMNSDVNALTVGRDGFLYAFGSFTTASNIAACAAARWTGTAWAAMASGLGIAGAAGTGYDAITDLDGNILAGGDFTQAGGGAACIAACGIVRWVVSSSGWQAVASGLRNKAAGTNGVVRGLGQSTNGDIWAAGYFDSAGLTTNTACRVAKYSQSASSWQAIGGCGISLAGANAPRTLALTPDGTAHIGTDMASYFYLTSNGVNLTQPASPNVTVYSVLADSEGAVYLGGEFTTINKTTFINAARLINSVPTKLDITIPSTGVIYALHSASDGVLTISYSDPLDTRTACAAAVTAVTNSGTAATYPILTASAPTAGSANLNQLVNYTTGERIYFNLTLNAREVVTLDLRPGKKTFTSNFRGNIISSILPGSDVSTWKLLPGANNVSFYMGSGSGNAKLTWTERFWSIDV